MHHVYIIRSIDYPDQVYVGCTEDLKKRLSNHNSGTTPHTAKYISWELVVYFAFQDKEKAVAFEEYLKSGAGREFRNRHLL